MSKGDHVALLSAMAEMGLKLRLDMPEQAMEVTTVFFRDSTPANEAHVCLHYSEIFFSTWILLLISLCTENHENFGRWKGQKHETYTGKDAIYPKRN